LSVLKILAAIILILAPALSKSQKVSIKPVPISADRSFTNIVGMCQDDKGFIWLADNYNGLLRYDGSNLISYKSNPRNPNSLISDNLECLYSGSKGNIWIGTYQNGLDRFEPETETFTHFLHNSADPSSLCSDRIGALLEDQNGTLWVGTDKGLDTLNRQTGKFNHIENNSADGLALGREQIRVLYEDKSGTIWIGCGNPFVTQDKQLHGLYKVDKTTGKITRYQHNDKDETSLIDNRVRAIFEDSRGVFWIGTAGDGLHIMDREKGIFQRCLYDPKNPHKLSRPPFVTNAPYAVDHITFINEDMQGCIWIGTYAGGINRYNPATKTMEYFGISADASHKTDKNDYWGLLKTKDNLLWVSGWEPANDNQVLYKISTLPNRFNYSHLGKVVESFAQDADGSMWLGTSKGLLRNTRDSSFSDALITFPKYAIANLEPDSLNNLWISTMSGLYYYDKITNTYTGFRHDDKNNNSITTDVVFVTQLIGNGKILVGTNIGLNELDMHSGIFKHYNYNPKDSGSINADRVTSIKKDRSGNIWVGTTKGLNRFDQHTGKFSNGLDVNGSTIFFIFEDSRSRVWVGTYRSGLYVYDQPTGNFSLFSDSTNLVNSNMLVRGMAEDSAHLLWLNTDIGFIQLNPETKNAVLFGKSWGVDPKITFKNGFTSSTGEIHFGDKAGYYHFLPQRFNKEMGIASQPYISKFYISNKQLIPGTNKTLPQLLSQTEKITLSHSQNNFAIEFNNIDFVTLESEKNILFKLENYDDAWRKSSGEKKAYYYNVQPGQYAFKVKAVNSNGIWAERSISIIITPPWWNTWWFRTAAFICLIALLYGLIRWRLHEKFNRRLELSEKEKKLAELQQQKTELEMQALRAQMNPHFIFNSLNSINAFVLENNKLRATEYLSKFSRLIRLILQNSREITIPLDNELEALRLYLDLESLRFEKRFEYKIQISDEVSINNLKVPPLIIQPYVENAIWHGLMPKKEKGHLEIELFLNENILICKVKDDGIGRKSAAELKVKSTTTYKSIGMQITADRIAMLQEKKQNNDLISIKDLVFPDNRPAGTEVLIKIPLAYD
jgi:ligand-binding sensor domain-containing protein